MGQAPCREKKAPVLLALGLSLLLSACAVGVPAPPTDVTATSLTLRGAVHSTTTGDTTYWWKYGVSTSYGSQTPHRTIAISANTAQAVSEPLSGLTASTTYHYQLCAQDQEESPPRVVCSKDHTFGTIGDTPKGLATEEFNFTGGSIPNGLISFDAYSGPHSENGGGRIDVSSRYGDENDYAVTCLRLQGRHVTVGLSSADRSFRVFWFFDVPEGGGSSHFFTESIGKRPDTDCAVEYSGPPPDPESYDTITPFYEAPLTAYDAP